jgi:hypothetical protein
MKSSAEVIGDRSNPRGVRIRVAFELIGARAQGFENLECGRLFISDSVKRHAGLNF